jgi:hypothetical protein
VQGAKDYGIIDDEDIIALINLDPGTQDIETIKAKNTIPHDQKSGC